MVSLAGGWGLSCTLHVRAFVMLALARSFAGGREREKGAPIPFIEKPNEAEKQTPSAEHAKPFMVSLRPGTLLSRA